MREAHGDGEPTSDMGGEFRGDAGGAVEAGEGEGDLGRGSELNTTSRRILHPHAVLNLHPNSQAKHVRDHPRASKH